MASQGFFLTAFALAVLCLSQDFVDGAKWTDSGDCSGFAQYLSLAINSKNVPYVSYRGKWAKAKKLEDHEWVAVGDTLSGSEVLQTSFAFDSNDNPIAAFEYGNFYGPDTGKASVKKFNGTQWISIGSEYVSSSDASFVSVAVDSSDVPYVAFKDLSTSTAVVKKFTGTDWTAVGSDKLSGETTYRAFLKKLDGTNWVTVGSTAVSSGTVGDVCFALSSTNVPYVAYNDWDNGKKATVKTFDGTNWNLVGPAGFSAGTVTYLTIALDSNNVVHLGYVDSTDSNMRVMKFNGSAWEAVGSGLEHGSYLSLAIDSNSHPFLAFATDSSSLRVRTLDHITDVTPSSGSHDGGTVVTVVGMGLGNGSDVTAVTLDGKSATIGNQSEYTAIVTSAATTVTGNGDVTVTSTSFGTRTKSSAFSYNAIGMITRVSPAIGATGGGTTVTVSGTNLGSGTDITQVTLVGIAATINSQSATEVVVVSGAASVSGSGNVVIKSTAHGTTNKTSAYTYGDIASGARMPSAFWTTVLSALALLAVV